MRYNTFEGEKMNTDRMMAEVFCDEEVQYVRFFAAPTGWCNSCEVTYKDGSIGVLYEHYGSWKFSNGCTDLSINGGSVMKGREC
jgi:hypothetical protein